MPHQIGFGWGKGRRVIITTVVPHDALTAVPEVGPCPLCGAETVKNDRGGTTCVACAWRFQTDNQRRLAQARLHPESA